MGGEHQINRLTYHVIDVFQHIIQKIGAEKYYRRDQNGIIKRFLNEGENWNSHLNNSKAYILKILPQTQLESIAILGSGWLLDVPVEKLLDRTKKLILVDIFHPKQIVNKYKHNIQIEFLRFDLTNNLIAVAANCRSYSDFKVILDNVKPLNFINDFEFVVSLNLLNQLDILLCDFIKKKFKLGDAELIDVRKKIQKNHMDSLPRNKSCIITDYEEINYNGNDESDVVNSLLFTSLDQLMYKEEWLWKFDTLKSYRRNMNTTFRVQAGKY